MGKDKLVTLESLLQDVTEMADAYYGGHLTIMKFSTGWKAIFGTVNTQLDRDRLFEWPNRDDLMGALSYLMYWVYGESRNILHEYLKFPLDG